MSDSELINDFVIKPLMLRNRANTFEDIKDLFSNKTGGASRTPTPTHNLNCIKNDKFQIPAKK